MIYKITLKEKSTGAEIQTTEKTLKRVCKWLKDRVLHCYTLSDCDLKVVRCYDEATPESVIIESIEEALNIIALEEETSNFYAERRLFDSKPDGRGFWLSSSYTNPAERGGTL